MKDVNELATALVQWAEKWLPKDQWERFGIVPADKVEDNAEA